MSVRRSRADAVGSERNGQDDLGGLRGAERSASDRRGFAAAYREFAEEVDLATLAIDPDEVFGNARKRASGRDVRL